MYGGEDTPGPAHRGGIIRNNFFYQSSGQRSSAGPPRRSISRKAGAAYERMVRA
jgi:hypothetical protein